MQREQQHKLILLYFPFFYSTIHTHSHTFQSRRILFRFVGFRRRAVKDNKTTFAWLLRAAICNFHSFSSWRNSVIAPKNDPPKRSRPLSVRTAFRFRIEARRGTHYYSA
jgi:hypothetical protein